MLRVLAFTIFALPLCARADNSLTRRLTPPQKDFDYEYTFTAAFTYWAPYLEGINIAYRAGTEDVVGDTIRPIRSAYPGFKVGIGTNTFYKNISTKMLFTWFDNTSSTKSNFLIQNQTYLSPFDGTFTLNALTSKFVNQFNRIDAAVLSTYFPTNNLQLEIGVGASGTWDFENLTFNSTSTDPDTGDQYNRFTQEWWGVGPNYTFSGTYFILKDAGLFTKNSLAIFLTNHTVRSQQNILGEIEVQQHSINSPDNVEPAITSEFGLFLRYLLSDWAFDFKATWELQTYFSHNGFAGFYAHEGVMGNYSMQGLTLSLSIIY